MSDSEWTSAQQQVADVAVTQIVDDTDRLAAPAFEPLDESDLRTLTAALEPLARAASMQLSYPNAMGLPRLAASTSPSSSAQSSTH